MSHLLNTSSFLVQSLLALYLYVILLRFWMPWVRADFRNEFGQFILTVTNPIIIPLRRVIPSFGKIDTASAIFALSVAMIKCFLYLSMKGYLIGVFPTLVFGVSEFLRLSIHLFIAAIFLQVILSWVNPQSYNPITVVAHQFANFILAPIRQIIPPIAGLDLSPIFALILLQLLLQLLVAPFSPFI